MSKADALRAFMVEQLPELKRNPEALLIYLTGGRLVARYHPENLGFEYRARLSIDVLGFPGEPAQFFLPLILWLRRHEPAALQNHEIAEQQIAFEVDILDNGRVDISVSLPSVEAVDVLPQPGGGYRMTLREEPPADDMPLSDPATLLKRIFDQSGALIVGTPAP
ncbi:phage tail protein [Sphingobium sp. B11D3D]|uniref:phage tail protein n=1 Tax=Sphingobium sp. B11D3D TaxID=2940576 RepID=UPI0022246A34|nr:phage tail protein [Sphingobium sp. B11D3D]